MRKYNVYIVPCSTSTLLRIGHVIYELDTGLSWNTEYTPKEQDAYKIGEARKNTWNAAVQAYRQYRKERGN